MFLLPDTKFPQLAYELFNLVLLNFFFFLNGSILKSAHRGDN